MRRRFLIVLAVGSALLGPAAAQASSASLRPIPITQSSQPFGAMVPHSAPGMTEREYVFRGHARTFTDNGPTGSAPAYATRVLIRRPDHSNGEVVVELLNNSAGFEVEPVWDYSRSQLARQGAAWVGLTYDPAAVGFLQQWNQQRYAPLGAGIADPSQVWDVVSQLGRLIRDDHHVRRELLTGYSGPAPTVAAWANHFGNAASPYDAYLVGGSFGDVASLSATAEAPGAINPPSPTPVIRLDTETELFYTQGATRQADGPHLRTWEIAGGSHIDATLAHRFDEMLERDLGLPPIASQCTNTLNPLPVADASDAALTDLFRWAASGRAAPTADRVQLSSGGDIVRDSDGNALGGLRYPGIAVPTGTLEPTNSPANSSDLATGFCPLIGSFQPFSAARLRALYPTHGAYVREVHRRARMLERDRFLLHDDAVRLEHEAASSSAGTARHKEG
jgi:hypothetical protein